MPAAAERPHTATQAHESSEVGRAGQRGRQVVAPFGVLGAEQLERAGFRRIPPPHVGGYVGVLQARRLFSFFGNGSGGSWQSFNFWF